MSRYEYGYIISAGGETQTVILGQVDESGVEEKRKEIAWANAKGPGVNPRGFPLPPSSARYFIRRASEELQG